MFSPVTTENMDESFNNHRKAITRYHKPTIVLSAKNKWDTKEEKGKSMFTPDMTEVGIKCHTSIAAGVDDLLVSLF